MEQLEKAIEKLAIGLEAVQKHCWSTSTVRKDIHEILNPPDPDKFLECDTCRAKPGSPILCTGCLHNRNLIETLSTLTQQK